MGLEVGHADGSGPAFAVELLQRPPGLHVVTAVPGRQWPMDQEQVDVLGAESLERPFESQACIVRLVRVVAQLAGDEDLTAVQARPGNGLAHLGLVAVHLGGIDVPVPGLECRAHGGRRVLRLNQEDAEPELRNGLTIVQPDVRNGSHERTLPSSNRVYGPATPAQIRTAHTTGRDIARRTTAYSLTARVSSPRRTVDDTAAIQG